MFIPDLRLIFSALDLCYEVAAPMIETFPPAPAGGAAPVVNMRWQWRQSITRPIRAFQLNYVPVVVVYFAYGALGLIDVTRDLWIKESLSFTPSQLAGIGVWLTLPWTVKMVFGELVDTVPIFGSQRKSYILIGALLMATGLLILAGAAGRWLTFARPDQLYVLGAMLVSRCSPGSSGAIIRRSSQRAKPSIAANLPSLRACGPARAQATPFAGPAFRAACRPRRARSGRRPT
jgi:hypothetical protein